MNKVVLADWLIVGFLVSALVTYLFSCLKQPGEQAGGPPPVPLGCVVVIEGTVKQALGDARVVVVSGVGLAIREDTLTVAPGQILRVIRCDGP